MKKILKEDIKKIIPHREPFLLIDEITEITETTCNGLKYVGKDDFWVPGHFPEKPIMPGVLQIEALAQVGAYAVLSKPQFLGKIAYFAGINNVRFKKMIVPGDVLELKVELTKIKSIVGIASGKAYVNGEMAMSCELTFIIK